MNRTRTITGRITAATATGALAFAALTVTGAAPALAGTHPHPGQTALAVQYYPQVNGVRVPNPSIPPPRGGTYLPQVNVVRVPNPVDPPGPGR